MISVLDRLATEFRDVQRSAESVAEPFACLHVASRGGEGGGLVPRGPGQLWGPGPSWIFLSFFLIGSQWGIQDFDIGGSHLKKISPRYARHDLIVTIPTHTQTHTQNMP